MYGENCPFVSTSQVLAISPHIIKMTQRFRHESMWCPDVLLHEECNVVEHDMMGLAQSTYQGKGSDVQAMTKSGKFDFIKLDVEGEEKQLLKDPSSHEVLCEAICIFMEVRLFIHFAAFWISHFGTYPYHCLTILHACCLHCESPVSIAWHEA
jgi:hypothetical protein